MRFFSTLVSLNWQSLFTLHYQTWLCEVVEVRVKVEGVLIVVCSATFCNYCDRVLLRARPPRDSDALAAATHSADHRGIAAPYVCIIIPARISGANRKESVAGR